MKAVTWTDDSGYLRRALIRDGDSDDKAAEIGLPCDIPDLDSLDWTPLELRGVDVPEFKRDLHNHLTRLGLITWADVQHSQNGVTRAIMATGRSREILAVLKRPLILLYKTG